jgi:hypothetical protein
MFPGMADTNVEFMYKSEGKYSDGTTLMVGQNILLFYRTNPVACITTKHTRAHTHTHTHHMHARAYTYHQCIWLLWAHTLLYDTNTWFVQIKIYKGHRLKAKWLLPCRVYMLLNVTGHNDNRSRRYRSCHYSSRWAEWVEFISQLNVSIFSC